MDRLTGILAICLTFVTSQYLRAQATMMYEGPFQQGQATYEYLQGPQQQQIFQGAFTYNELRAMPLRGGNQNILVTGHFKEGKKHLVWAVTVKNEDESSGVTETIIGNYIEGEKSGLWTHRISNNSDGSELRFAQASFLKNHFRGPFKLQYFNEEGSPYISIEVTGSFNEAGQLDGEWLLSYRDQEMNKYQDKLQFLNGVLAHRTLVDVNAEVELETYDQELKVASFFANMHPTDSFATVDGEKLGLRKKTLDHPLLLSIIDAWTDLSKIDLSLNYNASIPTMIVPQGELKDTKRLVVMAELIDWKETPKGKEEIAKAKALEEAYSQKLQVADLQFNQGNYRGAIPLYKEAIGIKKDQYPQDQIKKAEEEIRKEEEKMRLITVVSGRQTLWKGNDKMLKELSYYGKKEKLYEASIIALDHQKNTIQKSFGETIAFIDRKAYENLSIESLQTFQAALDEAIAFQDKLKAINKVEDTKDLEKELKKLEDPIAIINLITGF